MKNIHAFKFHNFLHLMFRVPGVHFILHVVGFGLFSEAMSKIRIKMIYLKGKFFIIIVL